MIHTILTYTLHGAETGAYGKLNVELAKLGFSKVEEETTWEKTFQRDMTTGQAQVGVQTGFAAAAGTAGIKKYDLRIYATTATLSVRVVKVP